MTGNVLNGIWVKGITGQGRNDDAIKIKAE